MTRPRAVSAWVAVALALGLIAGPVTAQLESGPTVGDLAPDFSLPGSDGRTYTLAEFRGVRPVVIAWFPKAFAKL